MLVFFKASKSSFVSSSGNINAQTGDEVARSFKNGAKTSEKVVVVLSKVECIQSITGTIDGLFFWSLVFSDCKSDGLWESQ